MVEIVDLAQRVRDKEEAETKAKPPEGPVSVLYEFTMNDGSIHQTYGILMVTPAFFACGERTEDDQGVDFDFIAPIEQVRYVQRIPEDDLVDD